MFKFNSITMQYKDESISRYIVSYDCVSDDATINGQINISAKDADLSNILDVAKEKLTKIVNG